MKETALVPVAKHNVSSRRPEGPSTLHPAGSAPASKSVLLSGQQDPVVTEAVGSGVDPTTTATWCVTILLGT